MADASPPRAVFPRRRLAAVSRAWHAGAVHSSREGAIMEEKATSGRAEGAEGRGGAESAGFNEARRGFLKGALTVGGMAAARGAAGLSSVSNAQAQPPMVPGPKIDRPRPRRRPCLRRSERP